MWLQLHVDIWSRQEDVVVGIPPPCGPDLFLNCSLAAKKLTSLYEGERTSSQAVGTIPARVGLFPRLATSPSAVLCHS